MSGPGADPSVSSPVGRCLPAGLASQVGSSVHICQWLTKLDVCKFLLQKTNFQSHPESLLALNTCLKNAKEYAQVVSPTLLHISHQLLSQATELESAVPVCVKGSHVLGIQAEKKGRPSCQL